MAIDIVQVPETRPYSYSSVSKFLRCPYSYYLLYRKGAKSKVGPAAKVGIAVHEAMHHAFNQRFKGFSHSDLMTVFERKMIREGVEPGPWFNDANNMLRSVNFRGLFNAASQAEQTMEIAHTALTEGMAPVPFRFIIDLLAERKDRSGSGGIIWDYKTDRMMNPGQHKLQMSLYRACFMEQRGYKSSHCHLYYMRHHQHVRVQTFSTADTWAIVEKAVSVIRTEKFIPEPSKKNCNKPWKCGAAGSCEYYQR